MDKTSNKQRSAYWDNIKGLLMLLTVFAHILFQLQERSEVYNATVDLIYMFHMPAFVFISGFFGKSERSRSFESILKLIILYLLYNILPDTGNSIKNIFVIHYATPFCSNEAFKLFLSRSIL